MSKKIDGNGFMPNVHNVLEYKRKFPRQCFTRKEWAYRYRDIYRSIDSEISPRNTIILVREQISQGQP